MQYYLYYAAVLVVNGKLFVSSQQEHRNGGRAGVAIPRAFAQYLPHQRRGMRRTTKRCMDAFQLYSYQTTSKFKISSTSTMSNITLSDLTFITREDLASQMLDSADNSPKLPSNMAVVDVRDNDHIGGHIRGSTWVPSSELDYKTPELVRNLKDKEVVVFHCALSQQRGPSAALRYLREKKRLEPETKVVKEGGEEVKEGDETENTEVQAKDAKEQKVVVLSGGFTKWQEKYGPDVRLTEGWQKDIWEFGY